MLPTTTRLAVVALAALALPLAACGASEAELRAAKTSGYEADFAIVYGEALAATRELYPQLVEDARSGVIRTAWHPVRVTTGNPSDPSAQDRGAAVGSRGSGASLATTTANRDQYFVRFSIAVIGGKPWRIRVDGEASIWKAGEVPAPLRGADTPPWLGPRTDKLRLAIHQRLEGHAVPLKYRSSDDAPAKPAGPLADPGRFTGVPEAAAAVIAEVDRAASARDVGALRAQMADDFTWSLGSEPSADVAIATWQADPNVLAALDKALDGGCAPSGELIVCPSAAAEEGYAEPRAVFGKRGDAWRFIGFAAAE